MRDSHGHITIHSAIKPQLMRKVVWRASALAGAGGLILLYSGAILPVQVLMVWGLPLLAIGVALIGSGMIPYRRLSRLETNPNAIVIVDDHHFVFESRSKPLFTVPFSSLRSMSHRDGNDSYGICLNLHTPIAEKIVVNSPTFDMAGLLQHSQKKQHCDLFLPFFTERSYRELEEFLAAEPENG